jgi:putative acetyltransferase
MSYQSKNVPITIRKYKPSDLREMLKLFYDTVHTINAADYTQSQLEVWAPRQPDTERCATALEENCTYVALFEGHIVGFGDITPGGYLDRLYVHKDFQRQGIATALLHKLVEEAIARGIAELSTEASITARPFFEAHGYEYVKEQNKIKSGVAFKNYIMRKRIES